MPHSRPTAERWLVAEPDDDIRDELQRLLDGPADELSARFNGRLQFGTAGLRGAVGGAAARAAPHRDRRPCGHRDRLVRGG
ncbi:MAG: hypothetical protein ACK5CE_21480, partial [Actinomycetes bacterium]